jgi:signal transduction histidine kinase
MNLSTTVVEPAGGVPEITSLVHDMRSPLSAIHVSAEMLISSRLSEPQVHRIGRNLYGASVRMKELLDEVLTRYTGTDRGVEPSDIRELVTSAVDKVALVAEAQSVQIVQNIPKNLVITLDRQRIQRVLVNLFVNALDVMPAGGIIRISATSECHFVSIKVRDTGPGIHPEIRDRLFQPFATAGKSGGLGLGLAFSRQAVLDHGGQMWVETGGQGACFAFRLPSTGRTGDTIRTRIRGRGSPTLRRRGAERAELSAAIP